MHRPPTNFVGRKAECAAVLGDLEAKERLVTLLGPAGIGKTRLALECATSWQTSSPGRSLLACDLGEARDLSAILRAVARALDVSLDSASADLVAQLGLALSALGRAVFLLDNFEQLVEFAPGSIGPWLALAPEVSFLVTSRERLRISGEICRRVPPLGLPNGSERSEAVDLLVSGVRLVRPDYVLADEEAPFVAELVRVLEGSPLAIEICAPKLDLYSARALLNLVAQRQGTLASDERSVVPRRSTLRAAMEWSWDLLRAGERSALARCSTFRGGWSMAAAQHVLGESANASDLVRDLYDKSLLRVTEGPPPEHEIRFAMLEAVRELATEKLADLGEREEAERRHAEYFVRVASDLASGAHGSDAAFSRSALLTELDNVLVACRRALATEPRVATSGLLALEAIMVSGACGPPDEYIAMCEAAVDALPADRSPLSARLCMARGRAEVSSGLLTAARSSFERTLTWARRAGGESRLESLALTHLACLASHEQRWDQAEPAFRAAEEALAGVTDLALKGTLLSDKAIALFQSGQIEKAIECGQGALSLFRTVGDRSRVGMMLGHLAFGVLQMGRTAEARLLCEESVAILRDLREERTLGHARAFLGRIHIAESNLGLAAAALEDALKSHRRTGDRLFTGLTLGFLGLARLAEHRWYDACHSLDEGTETLLKLGQDEQAGVLVSMRATALANLERISEAEEHFRRVQQIAEASSSPLLFALLEVQRAHVDLAHERALAKRGERAAARRCRTMARGKLCTAKDASSGVQVIACLSEDVRLAIRLLDQAFEGVASDPTRPVGSILTVGPSFLWVAVNGTKIELEKRRAVRQILAALIHQHEASPGRPLSRADVQKAGWPSDALSRGVLGNRLNVALTTMRKLGLDSVLESRPAGLALRAGVRIARR
jgi:predicted ATPase